ncbi:MAG: DUF748 domain-containing protein [Verrucomicrobiota bacterium]
MISVAILVIVLVGARIALPYVVKKQVNDRLGQIPGYAGSVKDIGISLLRGAYTLEGLEIYRVTGEVREPFVLANEIDFSVAWRELFRGKIVSDIYIEDGQITFVAGDTAAESQKDLDKRWQDVIEDIFPIDITHLEMRNGLVRYQDTRTKPHVDLFVRNMRVLATGLRNRPKDDGKEFPADILIEGDSLGRGKLRLAISADPLAEQPHFHLSAKLDEVNLPDLNESLRAYANVDVSSGTFRVAAEMAGKDGGFQGYVKPFFENVNFNNVEDRKKNVFSRLWENMVQGVAWLVKNKHRDQVGTRIPFQGQFGDPKYGLLTTIANLFRHGFIRAFDPTIEGSVKPDNVLPTGKSADGKEVAEKKVDTPQAPVTKDVQRVEPASVGASTPTGRPKEKNTK